MTTKYNGKPGLVAYAANVSIASSTDATPIVVTTATAHGRRDGDIVRIVDHATNNTANGFRRVTVLTSTTLALQDTDGSDVAGAGAGAGGATGTVRIYATSDFDVTDDASPAAAMSPNVGIETLADRSALALQRLKGGLQLSADDIKLNTRSDDAWASWASHSTGVVTWLSVATASTFIQAPGDVEYIAGDLLELEFDCTALSPAAGATALGLFVGTYGYGASAPAFGSCSLVDGSPKLLDTGKTMNTTLRGYVPIGTGGGVGGKLRVYLGAYCVATGGTLNLYGAAMFCARLWRPI